MSLVLAALALLQQEVPTVTVHMKDGNALTGPTNVAQFKIESSLGTIEVKITQVSRIQIADGACSAVLQDGTTIKGKLLVDEWKVTTKVGEFTVKTADIQMISWAGMRRVESATPAPPPKPPDKPAETGPAVKPLRTLALKSVVTAMLSSADGKKLYALVPGDSKLMVIDADTLQMSGEIAMSPADTTMTWLPSGKSIAAGGRRTVSIVGLAEGKVTKSFQIESEFRGLCALDEQTLAVAGGQLFIVSVPKQAITGKFPGSSADRVTYVPSLRKVYSRGGVLLSADAARGQSEPKWMNFRSPSSGELTFSPDGRYAVSQWGEVYRTGKSFVADMAVLGKTEVHVACVFRPSQKRVLLFTPQGFVKEYDSETWELVKSWELGVVVFHAFIDDAKGALHVFATPPAKSGPTPRADAPPTQPGDVHTFELPK